MKASDQVRTVSAAAKAGLLAWLGLALLPVFAATASERRSPDWAPSAVPGSLHPEVRLVLGTGSGDPARPRERHTAARRLRATLSETDLAAITEFLTEPGTPAGLDHGEWHALANDLLNTLRSRTAGGAGAAGRLLDVSAAWVVLGGDAPVLADYGIQHLSLDLPAAPGQRRAELLELVFAEAARSKEARSGTALLALDRLSAEPRFGDEEVARLENLAVAAAADPGAHPASRGAAFGLAERRGLHGASAPALEVAAQPGQRLPVRLAAMRAAIALDRGAAEPVLAALCSPGSGEAREIRELFQKNFDQKIAR